MNYSQRFSLAVSLFLFSTISFAQLSLPPVFSDNMVLQRNKPVVVWGKAKAGELVIVEFAGQHKSIVADSLGHWQLWLDAMNTSAQPKDFHVQASSEITYKNVLVGDVWLCSGQSNMEYPLDRKWKKYTAPKKGEDLAEKELANINKPDAIRYLYVERTLKKQPELPSKGWFKGTDTTVRFLSAIGYFFAKEIYEQTHIPIGIISSSWGGTRIEQWIPDWAYQQSSVFKDSTTKPDFKIDGMHPGQMFNGMIQPMLPLTIKGILWYQGESDLMIHDHVTYPAKFKLFADTWRSLFKDENLPLYYVQIAPFLYTTRKDHIPHTPQTLSEFWETQSKSLELPNTGMVVTTDLVDDLSNIHPSYKWVVAHRLALIALAKLYGKKKLVYQGPVYESMKVNSQSVELSFANVAGGLKSSDGKPLSWFTIAGEDGNFVPANAEIKGKKIIVSSPEITVPKYVRFAWDEKAQPNLINKEDLPAAPFRTGK
ncbi:MAG: sialate O-acetylesterase [Bacteroidota bacterium]|nr:sialate O-acetylesterase [Bacteroidota bacterium]